MTKATMNFLFVACDEPSGRFNNRLREDVNRHAQRRGRCKPPRGDVTPQAPPPYVLKFKAPRYAAAGYMSRNLSGPRSRTSIHTDQESHRSKSCQASLEMVKAYAERTDATANAVARHADDRFEQDETQKQDLPSPKQLTLLTQCWPSSSDGACLSHYANGVASNLFCDKNSEFWEIYVLQQSEQLAVTRKAVIAFSITYNVFGYASQHSVPSSESNAVAVGATDNAICTLGAYMQQEKQPLHAVVLTCALLLYAQARVSRQDATAACHLDRAISIFDSWGRSIPEDCRPHDFYIIQRILLTLDLETAARSLHRLPKMVEVGDMGSLDPSMSVQTKSLEHILYGYNIICQKVMSAPLSTDRHDLGDNAQPFTCNAEEKMRIKDKLAGWKNTVDNYYLVRSNAGESSLSPREEIFFRTIMLHFYSMDCDLAEATVANPLPPASAWDRHADELLEQGERLLELRRQADCDGVTFRKGWKRSLFVVYAQSLLLLAKSTSLLRYRDKALDLVAAAGKFGLFFSEIKKRHGGSSSPKLGVLAMPPEHTPITWFGLDSDTFSNFLDSLGPWAEDGPRLEVQRKSFTTDLS